MSKTKIVTLDQPITIEKLIPGGQGLATLPDGKKGFFWNVLLGESILEYQITKQKSKYVEAIAAKITSPSPHRIAPKDPCYLSTSPWQIIDYPYELQLKQELVVELFREHHIDIATPEIFTDSNDYHYRNKMEYALYWDHDTTKIHLAFHQRGSHRKIPITRSSIERPEIFARATEIIDELNRNHDEARRYLLELFSPYDLTKVDAIVLGCTHYVFLRPILREILPENVSVLDGNEGTARQLRRVLAANDLLSEGEGSVTLETSGNPVEVLPVMQRLLERA